MPGSVPDLLVDRRPIIGVMGSHSNPYAEYAHPVGEWVAKAGYHLLTGAGGGVMAAVSKAFAEVPNRAGHVIGVVPSRSDAQHWLPMPGYPNPWVEIPVYTHLDTGGPLGDEPMSRNHVNVLTSTVVVLLPGGEGTASEARLALRYDTPCIAFVRSRNEIPSLPDEIPDVAELEHVVGFVRSSIGRRHSAPPRAGMA